MIYFGKGMMMRFVVGKEGCVVEVREVHNLVGVDGRDGHVRSRPHRRPPHQPTRTGSSFMRI